MINQLNPYPAYKSSGIDWLGNIPNHWKLDRVRYLFNYEKGKKASELTLEYISNNVGNYPVFSGQTENEGLMGFINSYEFSFPSPIVIVTTVGARAMTTKLINGKFSLSQNCAIIRPVDDNIDIRFFYYQFQVLFAYEKANISLIMQPSLRFADLNRYSIVLPPLPEQKAIAAFLDHQTAKIDALIAKLERLVELLQEKRTALISQAVTKGLDPSVPMKDSGIEWLGEIPDSWIPIPLKHVCYIKGRIGWQGLKQSEFTDEGPYLITGMNFLNGKMDWSNCYHITHERFHEAPDIHVKKDDVLITKDGSIGKLLFMDYLPGPTSLNSHLLILRPKKGIYFSKYLYYLLQSNYFEIYVENVKKGTTFYGISQESMENFYMLSFSPIDQMKICNYLDEKINIIDGLLSRINDQMILFKEYKISLINSFISGKFNLREING